MSDWQPPNPEERLDPPAPAASPLAFPPPEPIHPPAAEPAPEAHDDGWLRLDPRMLLVGPVSALRQFAIPALIALVGLSSSRGSFQGWMLPLILIAVLVTGLVPWLTTRYRFTETQFQRRSGLISRQQLTAPLDRVRSVDIESSLLHRMLGLSKVKVGTGVDNTMIELNSLGREEALALQQTLLARARSVDPGSAVGSESGGPLGSREVGGEASPTNAPSPAGRTTAQHDEVLATLDWSWVRFAPLNLARLAVVAAAVGFSAQFVDDVPILTEDRARGTWEQVTAIALPLLVLGVTLAAVVGWLLISVVGYVLQWSGMRLTRTDDTVRLTAGLLTTRSTSVEEKRIRGVQLRQPALMRLFGGAELATMATGVGSGGTSSVMPPSPLRENERVGGLLLDSTEPLHTPLIAHGHRARRRLHLRRQWWSLALIAGAVALVWQFDRPWWVAVLVAVLAVAANAWLAEAAYGQLGHALTPEHLVSRQGALTSTRTMLERDGIIGWVVTQNIFQRRAGLVTLIATTAAGSERVVVPDVPQTTAVTVAATATPSAVTDFLVT